MEVGSKLRCESGQVGGTPGLCKRPVRYSGIPPAMSPEGRERDASRLNA